LLFVAAFLFLLIRRVRWLAFPVLGFTLFMQAGTSIVDARLADKFAGESMLAQVRVADFPKMTGVSVAMLVEATHDERIPPRSRVTWFDPPQIPAIGDIWEFELRLRRPHGNSNPGLFSLENWMFREQLHAAGYVVAGKRNRLLQAGELSFVETYRRNFVVRAKKHGGSAAPVLAAIGVGTRHLISRQQWDRYAITGSSHLMAISGLHIGLAAATAFYLIAAFSGVLRLPGNHLHHAAIGAAGMAAAYAMISGFAVPSQRAIIMLGLAAVAFLGGRRADPLRIIAAVALLVFVIDPVSLMLPGFSLSFGAVVVLLWFSRRYWRPCAGLRFYQLLVMQFILLLGLMPLTVLIFQRIAIAAPLVNFMTVPVFSFITVPLTLVSMLLDPVWNTASIALLKLSAASIRGIEWLIGEIAKLSFADIFVAGVDSAVLSVVLLPALWIILPRGWPGRWIAVLAMIALMLNKPQAPDRACIDAHVLDVGQGLAVVVQSSEHTLVFDTGASYRGGGSAAALFVLPFLRYKGIEAIDWLVVSHSDDDHAGGVPALIKEIAVGRIFAGEEIPDVDYKILACRQGQTWAADGIEYHFLHPEPGNSLGGNDSSCVLSISAGSHQLVLTGDIEAAGERSVLAHLPFASVSVVLIPHHGSLTSSSPAFVNRLKPGLAVASTGYANRWGFPKARVTKRWEGAGAVVLDTASSGAVSFRLCERDGLSRLRQERLQQRRFWHDSETH
jgi:competence protein ComEC